MKVSVIIPAFNSEKYIGKALLSALRQAEVEEVVVVDDGSTDKTIEIAKKISKTNPRIKLFHHPRYENKGRSATRNLGIKNSNCEFIAFLDSDDYYLEDRFKNDQILFEKFPEIDGVYNAIGVHFYRKPQNQEEERRLKLTTLKYSVPPEKLFQHKWPKGTAGNFSGDGLTVRKSIFNKVGFFNEMLEVAEDGELWIKMSLKARLMSGILDKPVSIRGVHHNNVFHKTETDLYLRNKFLMYKSLLGWGKMEDLPNEVLNFFKHEKFKLFCRLIKLDEETKPEKKIFLMKNVWKKSFASFFYLAFFLYIYKPLGVGYFLRKRLVIHLKKQINY